MSTLDELMAFLTHWISDPLVINVFLVILGTAVISYFARKSLARLLQEVSSTENPWDDALLRTVRLPLQVLIWVIGLSIAAEWIAEARSQTQIEVIALVRYLAFIGLVTLFLTRLIKELEVAYLASGGDETTVTAVAKLLRISLFITAALMTMQTMGLSITGVLTFGGIGGIAVGFAAQDLLANLFGGLVIYLDRPFKVGDWIRSPDREIEGTVIKIGWRLTEIRTFSQRPLYIPNSTFSKIALENPSRML
ncbi:MAG: mechanosensitive ion channel family protein, partial [Pseudomonadales bacterium]